MQHVSGSRAFYGNELATNSWGCGVIKRDLAPTRTHSGSSKSVMIKTAPSDRLGFAS